MLWLEQLFASNTMSIFGYNTALMTIVFLIVILIPFILLRAPIIVTGSILVFGLLIVGGSMISGGAVGAILVLIVGAAVGIFLYGFFGGR